MSYPSKKKPVEGIPCPNNYSSYDQMVYDCDDCGEAKLYQSCRYFPHLMACAGWVDDNIGPCSCKGYVQLLKDKNKIQHKEN